ncbi:MAG TPA: alcohol dehydrogenase catalytic domain-containing protein [Herpetosiphonaceae bacterium]
MRRQSLLLVGPQQLRWVDEILPDPQPHEIAVRTLAGAISVGTELPLYRGSHRGAHPISYPKMTGYESYAEIISCGTAVEQLKAGDRVVATYGHRTHAVLAADRAIPVPNTIPAPLALLAILGCDTLKGIVKLAIPPDAEVLITGAGTIGLLTIFNLVAQNMQPVDLIEPIAQRRELALQLGARSAVAPQAAATLHQKYAVALECSSRDAAFALLQAHLRHAGRLCILADGNLEPLTLLPAFHEKELQILGSSDGEDYRGYAQWFWPHAQAAAQELAQLYELTIPATNLAQTFAAIAASDQPPIKVLVEYEL